MNFQIECSPDPKVCGTDITIRNQVWENEELDKSLEEDVIDIIDTNNEIIILVADPANLDNYLIIILGNDLLGRERRMFNAIDSKKGEFECLYITPAYDDNGVFEYIVTICYDYKLDTWATLKVYDLKLDASMRMNGVDP